MGIKISMQREVKERIRKEIIEAAEQFAEEYEIENYTDTASALNCVYAEFKNQFDWKIKQIGEYNAFIEWLKGLPMQFDYSYFDMRERIKYWFNQSNEEASKYSDEQVDKLYWNLLAREFFTLVKKFNVSGIIKSEDDTKVTPYDMDDYLDNDNPIEENISVSDVLSEKLTGVQTERHRTITVPRKYTQENDNLELTYTRGPDGEYWATIYRRLSNNDIEFETQLNKKFSTFAEFKSNVINMIEEYNNKFKLTDNNDMNDCLDNDNSVEESTIVSNTGPEDIEDYYIPIEYECVEDEDSDSDETRPYVDYFKYRIYLDEVMRLNPPEVIDGIEYHGYMGISNTMSYMIHIDPSGDAVIVRESGADKLYNPNKKEIAVEESDILVDNDKRNPKIIKENPDGSGQVEYTRYTSHEKVRRIINVTADEMNHIKEAIASGNEDNIDNIFYNIG